jgi:hypothetical protein
MRSGGEANKMSLNYIEGSLTTFAHILLELQFIIDQR